jgi:IS30 family transposase
MGKLSNAKNLIKAERYAIEGMLENGMGASEIAKSLGRDKDLIAKHIKSLENSSSEIDGEPEDNKGAAIMTESISQRLDSMRGKASPHTNPAIHIIDEQKKN